VTSPETRVVSADFSWKSGNDDLNYIYVDIMGKLNKESIGIYVFEDARLDGAKNKKIREIIKPEINMADENPRVSGTK